MGVHWWFIAIYMVQQPFRKAVIQPIASHPKPQNYYTPGSELGTAAC